MKHYKLFIIILIIVFACNPKSDKAYGISNIEEINIRSHVHNIPSIEDTVLQQLGGKLYFLDGEIPKDSITVIDTYHYHDADLNRYSSYKFIVHNKSTAYHKKFEGNNFDKIYKSYLAKDDDMPYNYSEEQKDFYYSSLNSQRKKLKNTHIDEAITKYISYWTYLTMYNGKFYLDDQWDWIGSFYLSDSILTKHYMDGIYPFVIEYFKEKPNGDLEIKTTEENNGSPIIYKLIDANLRIYQIDNYYIVPADNIYNFEIIEYANNTGDLIAM